MQVGVVLSLGDLVDTDDRRTFAALGLRSWVLGCFASSLLPRPILAAPH